MSTNLDVISQQVYQPPHNFAAKSGEALTESESTDKVRPRLRELARGCGITQPKRQAFFRVPEVLSITSPRIASQ